MPVSSSTEHWIKPDALKINLNHFGDPDYLQVSVLAGAVVMAFKQDVIDYNAAHNYRTWLLDAANTYLETPSAYHVYARLTRSEVNARALVIYDPVLRDIEGREITYVTDEETGKETEQLGEASEDYYYIFLGKISSSVSEPGSSVLREWESDYRSGTLETNQQQNDLYGMLGKMFRPHYDDPLDPDKLTWIEALTDLGVAGGITSFIENEKFDLPGIYDGLEIDNQTIVWEEIDGVKTLVAKGGGEGTFGSFVMEGTGNAITSVFEREENEKKVLVFNRGLTFAEKSYVDENFIKKDSDGSEFVTLNTSQTITGEKNFTGGLKVNGCELVYDSVNKYWMLEGDLLVTGGITSFADDTEFDPSTIMDALVLDGETLELQETVDSDGNVIKQLTVIGGLGTVKDVFITGEGNAFTGASIDEDGVMVFTRSKTFAEKSYLDNSFYTKEYINEELKKYVPIEGDCEIKGTKNFTGALQVNGQPIVYDVEGGYWKLDGDLLVTGGITSFGDDTAFTPSTIMDALILDQSTLKIDENGQLTVIGGTGSGTGGVDEDAVRTLIESYNYTTESSVKSIVEAYGYTTQSAVKTQIEAYGYLTSSDLPTATTSVKGIASFNSTDFTVSSGKVSLAARVKIVSSLPTSSSRTTNTLYVIV